MRWNERASNTRFGAERVSSRYLWRPVALVYENEYSFARKEWRWLERCDVVETYLGFPFGWCKFRWPGNRWGA